MTSFRKESVVKILKYGEGFGKDEMGKVVY